MGKYVKIKLILMSILLYIIVNIIGLCFNIYMFKWLVDRLWISVLFMIISIILIASNRIAGIVIAAFYILNTMMSEVIGLLIRKFKLNNFSDITDMEKKAEVSYHNGVFIWLILWLTFFIFLMMVRYHKKIKKDN